MAASIVPRLQIHHLGAKRFAARMLGFGDAAGNRAADAPLKLNGNICLVGFYDKEGPHLDNRVVRLFGGGFPYPKPPILRFPSRFRPDTAAEKGLQNVERGGIQLRHGQLKVVCAAGLPVLNMDAPLTVNKPGRPCQPLRTGKMRGKGYVGSAPTTWLRFHQLDSAVSLPSLVVLAAKPSPKRGRSAAIDGTKPLRSWHVNPPQSDDMIISQSRRLSHGCV